MPIMSVLYLAKPPYVPARLSASLERGVSAWNEERSDEMERGDRWKKLLSCGSSVRALAPRVGRGGQPRQHVGNAEIIRKVQMITDGPAFGG